MQPEHRKPISNAVSKISENLHLNATSPKMSGPYLRDSRFFRHNKEDNLPSLLHGFLKGSQLLGLGCRGPLYLLGRLRYVRAFLTPWRHAF